MFEVGERLVDGDQRNLGDRQDLFVIGKVLKYSNMDHLITFTEKLLHDPEYKITKAFGYFSIYHIKSNLYINANLV